jgi:hypothetical protein
MNHAFVFKITNQIQVTDACQSLQFSARNYWELYGSINLHALSLLWIVIANMTIYMSRKIVCSLLSWTESSGDESCMTFLIFFAAYNTCQTARWQQSKKQYRLSQFLQLLLQKGYFLFHVVECELIAFVFMNWTNHPTLLVDVTEAYSIHSKISVAFASRETTLTKYILKSINIHGT